VSADDDIFFSPLSVAPLDRLSPFVRRTSWTTGDRIASVEQKIL
jgi:hypothetical protein